jgi:branched-chain amino acid transport system ATP-binding protein
MSFGGILLEIKDVVVKFGGLVALNGVSLALRQGELRAVIGPNGAGKTTLFNTITGLVKPVSGRVAFRGRDLVHLPPHRICRLGVSRSFQLTSIFPELSVYENVWLGLNAREGIPWNPIRRAGRSSGKADKVEALCGTVGLAGRLTEAAGSLSHGDQKLLELAITLSLDPALLLLDEPTQGVSPQEIETIHRVIQEINRACTVLLIDHNMSTVRKLAGAISVLHQGQILFEGTPEEVAENARVQEVYLGRGSGVCL